MQLRSRKAGALAIAGMTCAAMFAGAPEASAMTWEYQMHTDDGDPGGVIKFTRDGDYIQLCDIEADGWAVSGQVSDNTNGYSLQIGGNGRCTTVNAKTHDLKEDVHISVRVCLIRSGRESYCDTSSWFNG
ncbi:hypothetical protein AB0L70_14295 [Kribbella sp. NPDC051952]|uniref:hypothetical protein n=1 Tax=Kribbella sp. NPDC051952 TaxID=3154851 RepID=UPI00344AEE9F